MKPRATLPPPVPTMPSPAGLDLTNPESLRGYLTSLALAVQGHLADRPPKATAQESRLFVSPDGKTWAVSIADDGTFVANPVGSTQGLPLP